MKRADGRIAIGGEMVRRQADPWLRDEVVPDPAGNRAERRAAKRAGIRRRRPRLEHEQGDRQP